MKTKLLIILLGLTMGLTGCSVQSRLVRDYKGKTQEELMLQMGRPTRTETLTGGRKIYIYEKSKFLKAAAINTGQFQYDRFESPKAIKNEIFKFYINAHGLVDDMKYEVSYGR